MISIIIPTYEMGGQGVQMLRQLIDSIDQQNYGNDEIIVSDNSKDDIIQEFCAAMGDINYYRNPGPNNLAANLNNALKYAKGDIIKPMMQDDYFINPDTLRKFSAIKGWAVCTSKHTSNRGDHIPTHNEDLYGSDRGLAEGCNTFGCPSAVAWERNGLLFDESLQWLVDCDFYVRLIQLYGQPEIIDTSVIIREWEGQVTKQVPGDVVLWERYYVKNKYADKR